VEFLHIDSSSINVSAIFPTNQDPLPLPLPLPHASL